MLKCFLFGIVIQINHVVEAEESKHFMLANNCTDYNTIQRSLMPHTVKHQYSAGFGVHFRRPALYQCNDVTFGSIRFVQVLRCF